MTFDQGVKLWSSPESQNSLIPTEKKRERERERERETHTHTRSFSTSYFSELNQSAELIRVRKTSRIPHISVASLPSVLLH